MKKVLVIMAALCLVFSMAVVASAAENGGSVYLDYGVSNTLNITTKITGFPDQKIDFNLSGFLVGGDYTFGNIKIGLDYASLEAKDENNVPQNDTNITLYKLKGGYQIVDSEIFKTTVGGGYLNETLSPKTAGADPIVINGIIIGGDVNYAITEKIGVSLGLDYGISQNWSQKQMDAQIDLLKSSGVNVSKTASTTIITLKGSYLITDSIGVTLGYTSLSAGFTFNAESGGITLSQQMNQSSSLITVGGLFKF